MWDGVPNVTRIRKSSIVMALVGTTTTSFGNNFLGTRKEIFSGMCRSGHNHPPPPPAAHQLITGGLSMSLLFCRKSLINNLLLSARNMGP